MFKGLPAIVLTGPVEESSGRKAVQLWLSLFFIVLIVVGLGVDSVQFRDAWFDGRQMANVLFVAYFMLMFYAMGRKLQRLMFVMTFLSYLGELLCSGALGMYDYKGNAIRLYVPFGHAMVYATGLILSQTPAVQNNKRYLKQVFTVIFVVLFAGAFVFTADVFTLVFAMLFFWVLRRKKWDSKYYCIALCAVLVEFVGTGYGCWSWKPVLLGFLPAANPPLGAVFIYAGGDVILEKILFLWDKRKRSNKLTL